MKKCPNGAFEEWWDKESGWGGELLSEGKLAQEAWSAGLKAHPSESYQNWVLELWEDGQMFDGRLDQRGLFICCTGLAGEVGEVLEPIKKMVRDGREISQEDLANEMGDVLYYLVRLGQHFDISLGDMMRTNREKLDKRYRPSS